MEFTGTYTVKRMEHKLEPKGKIVWEKQEFGVHALIEEVAEPVKRGSGYRTHRVWCNGGPASGRQWCYDLEHAIENAEYLFKSTYIDRVVHLEKWVARLHQQLHVLKPINPTQIQSWEDL